MIVQDIHLGPDYGATDTGSITCTSDAAPTQATTDAINYSVLYQNVPALTASAELLTTFQNKTVIDTTPRLNKDGTFSTYFAVTDSAAAQVFPMAFVNYRFLRPVLKTWWGQRVLLDLARRCQAQGPDARAENLLDILYESQRQENNPEFGHSPAIR